MIQTIRDYPYLSRRSDKSSELSRLAGRGLDVYWNREDENFIICLRDKADILLEFVKGEQINALRVREALWRLDRGGAKRLKEDLDLSYIAKQAALEKKHDDFREEKKKHLRDADKYESEGKRTIVMG
jgi:hypothetical protein